MRKRLHVDQVASCGEDRSLLLSQFIDDFWHETADKSVLVSEPPQLTGDPTFDARIAATVEALCNRASIAIPSWVFEDARYLEDPVWAYGCTEQSARSYFESTSLPEFSSRGLFLGDNVIARC